MGEIVKQSAPLVLKVLSGRLDGAVAELAPDGAIYIGYDLRNDVVVREPAARGTRLRLRIEHDIAELEVLEGDAVLLGQRLVPPHRAVLPAFTPVTIGDSAIAFGAEDDPQWARCEKLVRAQPAPDGDAEADDEPDPWTGWRGWLTALSAHGPAGNGNGTWVVTTLAILGCLALWAGGFGARDSGPVPTSIEAVQGALADAEFNGLSVAAVADGQLAVRGFLDTDGDKARLEQTLMDRGLAASIEVYTGDGLAKAVADLFRLQGSPALTRHLEGGVVEATGLAADEATVARLTELAEADVPGLAGLVVRPLAAPAEPDPVTGQAPADPGKRVATVVGHPNGYLVTDDGARYFPGAVLPSGHRIVAIDRREVVVEKDGTATRFAF